ncbi:MAG: hypothetical protein QCI38_03260, partial [Candidatus Thermoplasmatota archaeon]|nr:hypothetical protein [Candidatus Thermoplasmatota archaeon]
DRVSIPNAPLDILAQTLVGMSLEKRWNVDEAYEMVRRAYPYRDLSRNSYLSVLEYLGARDSDYSYSKLWYDKEDGEFGRKKGARMIYYLNLGAIPDEANYVVYSKTGRRLGKLSEKFVERLAPGDIFVLGGQSYRYNRTRGMKVFVEDSPGQKPTVPSWTGEMLPRSYDLSTAIGAFRRLFAEKVASGEDEANLHSYLRKNYHVDAGSARSILSYVREQLEFDPRLPTDKRLVIEGYIDLRGRYNLVFHACHGRRVNDALSRAYAMAVSNKYHCNVSVSITDDNFMLTLPRKISGDEVASLVTSSNLEELLRSAVRDTELFKQRFRHTASRSFMVLRNYRGREIGVGRQQNRAERIMKILGEEDEHPVVWETYNEILNQAMDLEHAREVLEMIENGQREVVCLSYSDVPSPFAHNVVLAGISDIVLMEDRSTLLRELHRRVLEKIMPEERMKAFLFDADVVRKHFEKKSPSIESCEDILAALETFGPLNLTQHKGDNIFAFSSKPDEIREQANLLLEHMDVASLWKRDLLWTLLHEAPYYTALVEKEAEEPLAPTIMDILEDPMTIKELRTELASRKDLGAVLGNAGKDGFGEGLDGAFKDKSERGSTGKDKSERGSTGKEKPGDAVKEKAKLEIGLGLVEDAVKHMERSNMVCRIGKTGEEYVYMRRPRADIPAGDLDRFVEKCIIRILGHHGPMTREELVYRTGFSSSAVSPCLKALEREGVVDTGHYVIGDDIQFILSEDLVRLKHGDAYSPAEIRRMLWNKHTMKARDIHEYFRRYPTVSRPYDLYPRTDAQAVKEWKKMRTSGDIIEGKFDNGRMCYIRKEDAALYIAAYRKREPRGLEKELLQAISRANGIASDELKKDFPEGQRLKDALSFLDKNMYLVKAYTGVDGWAKKSIYLPTTRIAETQWTGGEEGAWEEILRRFISTYGPVSVSALRFSGLGEPHVRVALSALESKKELVRIPVGQGRSVQEHVMLESELPLLEEACKMGRRREKRDGETNAERGKMGEKEEGTGPDKKAYIMSLFDPYVQPMWAELAARYGERWVYPCFIDGQLVGAVERWDMGGCHEIRDVMVEEPEHLSAVARAIKGEYKHHAAEGLDIIRVRYLDGEPVPNWPPEAVKAFTDQGFSELGDFLVMGPVSKVLYPWPQLLRYVFAKQHLGEYRLKETLDVVKAHGGVRGDGEVEARAENVIPIKNYQEEGVVQWIKGIPDLGTYATPKQAMLYQAARAKKMTKHMKMMYQVALEEKKLWRARVPDHSPLSEGAAFENLKKLFMGVYLGVDQNNSYVPLPISSISKAEARKEFVREMFKHFGLFNAPQLTAFIRGEFRTSEVRNILDELVKEGFLAKGFMRQDSEEVHWMLAEEHENIEAIQARPTGVITADDRLIYYLSEELRILYKMNTGYIVLKDGDIIGAFKAKKRKTHLEITDFFGEPEAKAIALEYAGAPPEKEEYGDEEWEIIQYVEKHIKRTGGEDRRRKRD